MRKKSTEEFILQSKIKYQEQNYDYSKTIYTGANNCITIICPKHGEFYTTPSSHLQGHGCKVCSNHALNQETFIKKANEKHNNYFNYSLVEFKTTKNKVKVICPNHGIFEIRADHHLLGRSCPQCTKENKVTSFEDFKNKANNIHKNKYEYIKDGYKNLRCKIKIICPIHGIFEQNCSSHLQGYGCPSCTRQSSKDEQELLRFVKSIYSGIILENDRNILNGKELDIYLPDLNLAIEFNGIRWHKLRENEFPGYHKEKAKLCKEKGIKLINISDKNWIKNKDKVKESIKNRVHYE